jgi:hypothetical protein
MKQLVKTIHTKIIVFRSMKTLLTTVLNNSLTRNKIMQIQSIKIHNKINLDRFKIICRFFLHRNLIRLY